MAINRVQSKTGTSGASSSVTTWSITFDSTPVAGNVIVAACAAFGSASIPGTPGYFSQTGVEWMLTNPSVQAASNTLLFLAIGKVLSGAGSTLTITTLTAGGMSIAAAEYSGLDTRFDRFMSAVGNSAAPASGATGTTSKGNQLWIGAISHRAANGGTFSSPTNSFSIVGQAKSSMNTTSDRSVCLLERIVTSTGTANAGAAVSPTGVWAAQVLTLDALPPDRLSVGLLG